MTVAVIGAAGPSGMHALTALNAAGLVTRALVHGEEGRARALSAGAADAAVVELEDRSVLAETLRGADAVLMIPPSLHPEEDVLTANAVRAAQDAGVRRFVYLSVLHPHTPTMPHHMRKAASEADVRHSGLSWTILQPGMYAQVLYATFGSGPPGRVPVPFDASRHFAAIDLVDLAEVAAKVVLEDGHDHASYELVGFSATMADHIETAGRLRRAVLEPHSTPPSAAPLPPRFPEGSRSAADMRAMFAEYDRHGLRGNSTVLTALLGRAPHTFEDVVRRLLSS